MPTHPPKKGTDVHVFANARQSETDAPDGRAGARGSSSERDGSR